MPLLVPEEYYKFYSARPGSSSCLFCLFVLLIALILPMFLTFSSKDFFASVERNYLSAEVKYVSRYALILNDDSGNTYFYSNIPKLQSLNSLNYAYIYGTSSATNSKNITIHLETTLPDSSKKVTQGTFMPVMQINITDYIDWYTQDY